MNHFDQLIEQMRMHNMKLPPEHPRIALPHAREVLCRMMSDFLSMENIALRWQPEYDEVADWLTDNRGRGLFLYGNCGRGKSLLTRLVLPAILLQHCRKVVTVCDVQEMNRDLDSLLARQYIALDDVGTEEAINHYGNRRLAFAEIMDAAEKQGKMLIVSSNLRPQELSELYGDRTLDRLKAVTRRVLFAGESLRETVGSQQLAVSN